MTIGIGFHCRDGVVLAADQQQTVTGYYKIHERKLQNIIWGGGTILWTYAHLPSLSKVMRDGLFSKLPPFPPELTVNDISDAISAEITEMRSLYPEEMKQQEFLYAISCGQGVRFLHVSGGIIDEPEWAFIGIGDSSLINFICQVYRSSRPMLMSTNEALTLAIYLVYLAKQFVDGCGGPTDAVILPSRERAAFFGGKYITDMEANFEDTQHVLCELYRLLTIQGLSKENVESLLGNLTDSVRTIRERHNL